MFLIFLWYNTQYFKNNLLGIVKFLQIRYVFCRTCAKITMIKVGASTGGKDIITPARQVDIACIPEFSCQSRKKHVK